MCMKKHASQISQNPSVKVDNPDGQEMMVCPKCGFTQPRSMECARCGIIISKYYAKQDHDKSKVDGSEGTQQKKEKPLLYRLLKIWFLLLPCLMALIVYLAYHDIKELQRNFPISPNLMLLTKDHEVIAGIILLPTKTTNGFDLKESLTFVDAEDCQELTSALSTKQVEAMLSVVTSSDYFEEEEVVTWQLKDKTHRIVAVDFSVLRESPFQQFEIGKYLKDTTREMPTGSKLLVDKQLFISILISDRPWDTLTDFLMDNFDREINRIILEYQELPPGLSVDDLSIPEDQKRDLVNRSIIEPVKKQIEEHFGMPDLKPIAFMAYISLVVSTKNGKGIKYLFSKFKSNEINIYPSTFVFDIMRLIPGSILNTIIDRVKRGRA